MGATSASTFVSDCDPISKPKLSINTASLVSKLRFETRQRPNSQSVGSSDEETSEGYDPFSLIPISSMVGPSFDTCKLAPKPPRSSSSATIKFLCSYGGKILPRYPDAKLRYHGGQTRVLAVPRSISFAELTVKMGEFCGTAVSLRCQLPTEDLDALVSITSDEDLANLIEEYDRTASPPACLKIRAFLSPPKKPSPPSSFASSSNLRSSSPRTKTVGFTPRFSKPVIPKPVGFTLCMDKSAGKMPQHYGYGCPGHAYLVHNGNHWQ